MPKLPPTIIDVEASGFGAQSYPVEVGLIRCDGERFCSLIKPADDWQHWDEQAQQLHGISRDDLATYGQSPTDVCLQLNKFVGSSTVYCDGWVVDYPWLIKLFNTAGVPMEFRVSSLDFLLKEHQMDVWDAVKEGLLAEFNDRRHRASSDAELIQLTYMESLNQSG
ncbi:3'-5' exonuclease [Salinimonas chungwhensis]|uniref:3'-5' exonuclease n=1 Tax=Salinimonas chungwhensis TaxID=265425 RepID=UPI00036DADE8|nr:exonuclease domain-containing protein [Salinimonas chungwhensis]